MYVNAGIFSYKEKNEICVKGKIFYPKRLTLYFKKNIIKSLYHELWEVERDEYVKNAIKKCKTIQKTVVDNADFYGA